MPPTDMQPTDVVYGADPRMNDQVWFVPREAATELQFTWAALGDAATWGDLREAFRSREAVVLPELWDWVDEDWLPDDEAAFVRDEFPGAADGDYPPHLGLLVPAWMPDDLRARHCEPYVTTFNGTYWYADPVGAPALAEALKDRGFVCGPDDELIGLVLGR
jgi:hypothetical protein